MTVEQVVTLFAVSVATIWRWRSQGILIGKRVLGRTVFDRTEVQATLRRRQEITG